MSERSSSMSLVCFARPTHSHTNYSKPEVPRLISLLYEALKLVLKVIDDDGGLCHHV